MSNNKQPSEVGDKVVAIRDGRQTPLKKGDVKIILGIKKAACGCWVVDVGFVDPHPVDFYCSNHLGLPVLKYDGIWWGFASNFAPYNPYSTDLTKELAEKAMQDKVEVDVLKVKETVNN